MDFYNLETALQNYIKEVAELYKNKLKRDNKKATGELINSVRAELDIDGNLYICELSLVDYYKWVEDGSRPHWPPPDAIKKWIKDKPILPREVDGIKPTNDQLAYLIGRKIARKGISAGLQLSETIEELNTKWLPMIEDALTKDIEKYLEEIMIE